MSNDKTYDRHINIWINGKEVKNDISSIKKEMFNLTNQLAKTTRGSAEYNQKAAELKKVKGILKEHQDSIAATGSAWTKAKGLFTGAQGIIMAGVGALVGGYQSLKGVISSTDALGDKFTVTLAGWKGGLDAVYRSLATMTEGGLKDFGKKIREGIEEGRRYAESLDVIDEKMRALQMQEADAKNEIIIQRNIQNTAKSNKDRIEAGQKIIALKEKLEKIRIGIGRQAYENEATNIANITNLTLEEVEAFARQEDKMVAGINAGKEYNAMLAERNALDSKAQGVTGVAALSAAELERYEVLRVAINGASEDTKRFAFAALNMPGDEKMQMFVDKYIAMREAMTSATENTLRIQSKLATALGGMDKTAAGDTSGLEGAIAKEFDPKYNAPDSASVDAELQAYIDKQKAANDEIEEDNKQTRDQMAKDLIASTEEGWQEIKNRNEDEKFMLQDKINAYVAFGAEVGETLGNAMADGTLTAKEAAKELIFIALDALGKYAEIAIAESAARSIATYGPIAGGIRAAVQIALIKAAIGAAKGVIGKNLYTGGYTGPGDKFAPAGIVHKGEYVVPADLVSTPQFGPMLEQIEDARVNGKSGYANGGGVGSSAGSSSTTISSDPELKKLIRENIRVNKMLLTEGVKNNWTYKDVDNMRKGMSKLEDVEREVTLR